MKIKELKIITNCSPCRKCLNTNIIIDSKNNYSYSGRCYKCNITFGIYINNSSVFLDRIITEQRVVFKFS